MKKVFSALLLLLASVSSFAITSLTDHPWSPLYVYKTPDGKPVVLSVVIGSETFHTDKGGVKLLFVDTKTTFAGAVSYGKAGIDQIGNCPSFMRGETTQLVLFNPRKGVTRVKVNLKGRGPGDVFAYWLCANGTFDPELK